MEKAERRGWHSWDNKKRKQMLSGLMFNFHQALKDAEADEIVGFISGIQESRKINLSGMSLTGTWSSESSDPAPIIGGILRSIRKDIHSPEGVVLTLAYYEKSLTLELKKACETFEQFNSGVRKFNSEEKNEEAKRKKDAEISKLKDYIEIIEEGKLKYSLENLPNPSIYLGVFRILLKNSGKHRGPTLIKALEEGRVYNAYYLLQSPDWN